MSSEVVTTVLAPASTYDLTDLATVKSELSLKPSDVDDNAFLKRGITQVSKAAANYCNRVFPVETLSDLFYMDRMVLRNLDATRLQLTRWPIVAVLSIVENVGLTDEAVLTQGTDFLVQAENGQLLRADAASGTLRRWTARTVTVTYAAGYGDTTTQSATIPATPGPYTVQVSNAAFAVDLGVLAGSTKFVPVASSPAEGQYTVSASGLYTFNSADQGTAIVISFGYTDIPDDLIDAVLRMVTQRFKSKDRDPMLMSRTQPATGDERYWVGATPGQDGAFPPEIASLLDSYAPPTVG